MLNGVLNTRDKRPNPALVNVRYDASTLQFDFPNGEETISFAGRVINDTIVGRVVWREQVHP